MDYELRITPAARRQYKKLPLDVQKKIRSALDTLVSNPYAVANVKKLTGREGYRLRVGDYRVLYSVEESALVVTVIYMGHRRDVYH